MVAISGTCDLLLASLFVCIDLSDEKYRMALECMVTLGTETYVCPVRTPSRHLPVMAWIMTFTHPAGQKFLEDLRRRICRRKAVYVEELQPKTVKERRKEILERERRHNLLLFSVGKSMGGQGSSDSMIVYILSC